MVEDPAGVFPKIFKMDERNSSITYATNMSIRSLGPWENYVNYLPRGAAKTYVPSSFCFGLRNSLSISIYGALVRIDQAMGSFGWY